MHFVLPTLPVLYLRGVHVSTDRLIFVHSCHSHLVTQVLYHCINVLGLAVIVLPGDEVLQRLWRLLVLLSQPTHNTLRILGEALDRVAQLDQVTSQ